MTYTRKLKGKRRQLRRRNLEAHSLEDAQFRLRVTRDRTKYTRESQMIGSTYDAQSKMRNGKLKRVTATKQQDDWKQQRRKQRRVRQQEKEHRYGNAREISRRS